MLRAVIFDLDGTLLDTLEDLADAMNHVLQRRGFPVHPVEAYKGFVGEGIAKMVERAFPTDARLEADIRSGIERMREEYATRWNRKTRPYAGIPELLDVLADRRVPMGVLSNKPHAFVRRMVDAYFGSWEFAGVIGESDGRRKPDPAGALEIRSAMGLPAAQICLLGDTWTDMETARRAGMVPVGALWGFRSEAELERTGAAALIARPGELLDLFEPASGAAGGMR